MHKFRPLIVWVFILILIFLFLYVWGRRVRDIDYFDPDRYPFNNILTSEDSSVKIYDLMGKIDKFFRDNNIVYWATAGTLIGSLRHGGLIPWDDDIDVAVPDDQKERLDELFKSGALAKYGLSYRHDPDIGYRMVVGADKGGISTPYADIFLYKLSDTDDPEKAKYFFSYFKSRMMFPKEKFFLKEIFPLTDCQFGPHTIRCPNNPYPYLDRTFKGWKDTAYITSNHTKRIDGVFRMPMENLYSWLKIKP